MLFDIQVLEKRKIHFDQVFAPGVVDLPDEAVQQIGDLRAAGVAELVDPLGAREIHVRGSLQGELEVACARCLEPLRIPLAAALDLYYRPMREIAREEEVAISEAETEIGFYEDPGLELADVVREQVLFGLPMRSVCRDDCRGLCPICGVNRNLEPCSCRLSVPDTRWDVLKNWKD